MVSEDAILIVVAPLLLGWTLWLLFKRHQLQVRARMQRQENVGRLIDKFGTAKELVDFLDSSAGRKVLEDPVVSADTRAGQARFVVAGIGLVFLGGACFVNALHYRGLTDINFVNEAIGLNNWGTTLVCAGAALLVSSVVLHFMSKRLD